MKHTRILIFTGGELSTGFLNEVQEGDFIIGADRGALFLIEHGIKPDLSVGDFDSIPPEQMDRVHSMSGKVIDCDPIDKNLTDTELAFELAMERSPESIMILGLRARAWIIRWPIFTCSYAAFSIISRVLY